MARLLLKGIPLVNIDGVLFDKDGTLSHSEPHLIHLGEQRIRAACQAWNHANPSFAGSNQLVEMLKQSYGLTPEGVRPDGILAVASRQHNLIATATVFALLDVPWPQALRLAEQAFAVAEESITPTDADGEAPPIPLLPDARRLLMDLRRAGILCAVISNDSRQGIDHFLKGHGLHHTVDAIWSADHHPCKPDPEAVHRLCASLQLDHRRCALIGDADSDLLMGRQAGVAVTLGYVAGWRQPPRLSAHEHLIHNWSDLQVDGLTS